MSKLLLFFSIVCFGTYHSLLVMEEQISTFTKNINQPLKKDAYSAIYYVNKEGDNAIVSQAFPQTIETNYFARVGESNTEQVSLFLNALLGNKIKKESHLIKYFSIPYLVDCRKHLINCHSVSEDKIPNGYLCFSLESRIFATFDTPIVKNDQYYDRSTIILRHLDHELKEKNISMPYGFSINSFFVAGQYLVIGSHVLENQNPTKKINNKYHIDIFDVAAFIKNDPVTSDNLNGDLKYYLGIDIEDTNTNTNPEDNDSLFTLESVHKDTLCLYNQRTKQYVNLNFLNRTELTEQVKNTVIYYALQKPTYLEIFSIFDKNIISPFTDCAAFNNGIIPVIRYGNKHGHYVEVEQTCPVILNTNFFIKAEEKSFQDIHNYTEEQRKEEIDFGFNPDQLTTIVDTAALRLLINTFLGNIETNQSDLPVYYKVQKNTNPQQPTIIECCRHAKGAYGMPSSETYRCFSLESRLLATYSSAFNPSCPKPYDKRYQIDLQHLDNKEKKYTIHTNEDLTIQSIFLKKSYLIVGSSPHQYSNKKSKYHIDIYNATKFSKNSEVITSSNTNNSVDYCLSIDVKIDAQYSAETQAYKFITVTNNRCILFHEKTNQYIDIPYLLVKEEKRNIDGYSVTYRKNPIPESIPKSKPESKSSIQNNKPQTKTTFQSWFKNYRVHIGISGTMLLFILLYGCYNKKCFSFFY